MTSKTGIMKNLYKTISTGAILISVLALNSCTEIEPAGAPVDNVSLSLDLPTILTVGLHQPEADTKLSYGEVTYEGRKALKTLWSEGDALIANASPGSITNSYIFRLKDGQGSGTGVFECTQYPNGYRPDRFSSNAWTLYFPESIKEEADYLSFSYAGQVQNGNGSMAHLKDYHTIRLSYYSTSERQVFDTGFINFAGEGFEESGCMKFSLSGLPSTVVPTKITLSYIPEGDSPNVFHLYNTLRSYFGSVPPNNTSTNSLSLDLTGFGESSSVTAYMMLSNADIPVKAGAKFRVALTSRNGKIYICEKPVNSDVTLKGGRLHSITCTNWTEADGIDGFYNPTEGVTVLQEAEISNGSDIIIMADGFANNDANFADGGKYETVIRQAYEDFFSVEPYKSLKGYFNVYSINAVSEDEHDAKPYTDKNGAQNGATQGTASTVFRTTFQEGSTNINGDVNMVIQYAAQAIRSKGGKGGTAITDEEEVYERAYKSLSIVMVNVPCHAGTCFFAWSEDGLNDFGNAYSVAYTSLNTSREARRWTTIHEAGGHGFGKLADEYGGMTITSIENNSIWIELERFHSYGVNRNINQYNSKTSSSSHALYFPSLELTNSSNVYWAELLKSSYGYTGSEGLGIYEGANTYNNLFCRPSENSIMRNQFGQDGQFFNAISRWAIWYRLMRLTGNTSASQFKNSLNEFISFDSTLDIRSDSPGTRSFGVEDDNFVPCAPPVMIKGRWEKGKFISLPY